MARLDRRECRVLSAIGKLTSGLPDTAQVVQNPTEDHAQAAKILLAKVNSLRPNPPLLIALHSPALLRETGLSMRPPEKSQLSDRVH